MEALGSLFVAISDTEPPDGGRADTYLDLPGSRKAVRSRGRTFDVSNERKGSFAPDRDWLCSLKEDRTAPVVGDEGGCVQRCEFNNPLWASRTGGPGGAP